jgi:pimeloyl-ACP methyl ester carboxylesterase
MTAHAAEVLIPSDALHLPGTLTRPNANAPIVLFAHGSGSSRFSRRNRQVAAALGEAGLGTLLFDLLSEEESLDRGNVFDIRLLARRLGEARRWVAERVDPSTPIGFFGASTGAAAALVAAADGPAGIGAIVSRGGRPDLAGDALGRVRSPTLLIVGGADLTVLELNRRALHQLAAPRELAIVPGATHLFEEPGALEEVARLATAWFSRHLHSAPRVSPLTPG